MLMRRQSGGMKWATVLGTAAMFLAGCGDETPAPAPATQPAASAPAAAADAPSTAVLAMLVKADAADDKTDKVVAKCAGCKLGMLGKAEFASKVGEYTVHLCSDDCKKGFDADPSKIILALKIDE